ncbi:uncharacterized protein LOC135928200 [Gordionus sp. m RMFG-2023]|uniref:uncharacterized protein LOC135928200 n=1 Tax=Gordionus sp. m RMFG-2023 TaxID=3053472 RepID=UPI0031FE36FC
MNDRIVKEMFYEGHSGANFFENIKFLLIYPLSSLIMNLTFRIFSNSSSFNIFFILVQLLPLILGLTLMSSHINLILLFQILILTILLKRGKYDSSSVFNATKANSQDSHIKFITSYMVYVLLATLICILGVDFRVFPRHLAKSEFYGLGFMDFGVGAFVFTNALISQNSTFRKTLKSSGILILFGVLRTLFIKHLNYHEHISEYGSHWNFFITLASVKLLGFFMEKLAIFNFYCCKRRFSVINGILLNISFTLFNALLALFAHYFLINNMTFIQYFDMDIHSLRTDWIMSNREGILSFLGYLSIYIFGTFSAKIIFYSYKKSNHMVIKHLFFMCIASAVLCIITVNYKNVSRRVCNPSYIIIAVFLNIFSLLIFATMDAIENSCININQKAVHALDNFMEKINHNGLILFIIANIFTESR